MLLLTREVVTASDTTFAYLVWVFPAFLIVQLDGVIGVESRLPNLSTYLATLFVSFAIAGVVAVVVVYVLRVVLSLRLVVGFAWHRWTVRQRPSDTDYGQRLKPGWVVDHDRRRAARRLQFSFTKLALAYLVPSVAVDVFLDRELAVVRQQLESIQSLDLLAELFFVVLSPINLTPFLGLVPPSSSPVPPMNALLVIGVPTAALIFAARNQLYVHNHRNHFRMWRRELRVLPPNVALLKFLVGRTFQLVVFIYFLESLLT